MDDFVKKNIGQKLKLSLDKELKLLRYSRTKMKQQWNSKQKHTFQVKPQKLIMLNFKNHTLLFEVQVL